MKILTDLKWNVFDWFPRWQKLSLETRRLFIEKIDSTLKISGDFFSDEQIHELELSGLKLPDKAALVPDIRPFRNLMRSMSRHFHFDPKIEKLSSEYITDHLTSEECSTITRVNSFRHSTPVYYVQNGMVDSLWLDTFLNVESYELWEEMYTTYRNPYLHADSADLLKKWIQHLIQGPNPIPFGELPDLGNGAIASEAFRAGIRYMLLFPALDSKTLDPIIGIWPEIHKQKNRKKLPPPSPLPLPKGCKSYCTPLRLHDMTTLLVGTTGDGLRLKAHGDLYQKEIDRIAGRLMASPPGYDTSGRLDDAFCWILATKLAARKGKSGKEYTLQATSAGRNWLAGSEAERLQSLADFMRQAYEKSLKPNWVEYGEISFLPYNPNHNVGYQKELHVEARVCDAFDACLEGDWFLQEDFLGWNGESNNPLPVDRNNPINQMFRRGFGSESERERCWKRILQKFLHDRLVPLGGVKLAINSKGQVLFSITPVGKYLMGKTDQFDYRFEIPDGDLIVQPNFDVVFTAANPFAEGELTRYAERIGHGVGTLFKITRESILLALNSGMNDSRILESLGQISSKKLPRNVTAQIQDWSKSFRCITLKNITVIDCGDPETALRIRALFPQKTTPITATLLEITGEKNLTPFKKKLRENGIGIG